MEPLAQIGGTASDDVIEAGPKPAALESAPAPPLPPAPEIVVAATAADQPPPSAPSAPAPSAQAPSGPAPELPAFLSAPARNAAPAAPAANFEKVIPLIHAPDDPGPDGDPPPDPLPDVPPPPPTGWDRLRAQSKLIGNHSPLSPTAKADDPVPTGFSARNRRLR
jgi:hypothetical protein